MEDAKKRNLINYFALAAITFAFIYVPMLFDLLKPALTKSAGEYATLIVSAIKAVFYFAYIILFFCFAEKLTGYIPFGKKQGKINVACLAIIFVLTAAFIFITSVSLGWDLHITYLLGLHTTVANGISQIAHMAVYVMKIFLAIIVMCYMQEAFEIIFKDKIKLPLPYGGIFLFVTFGLIELFLNPYPVRWALWCACLACGVIYLLSGKRFYVVFIASVCIYLL